MTTNYYLQYLKRLLPYALGSLLLAFGFNTVDVCENNTVWAWEQIGIAPNMTMLEWHWYLIGVITLGLGAFLIGYAAKQTL